MISYILNKKSPLFWLVFHIIFGAASIFTPWILIAWFYLVLLTSLVNLFKKSKGSFTPLVFLIAYATSFELLARMAGTSPFIPYEMGKYFLFVLLIFGILKGYRKGRTGWIMLLLLLPGVFINEAGQTTFKNIVFNLLGPINVALAVVYFRKQEFVETDFTNLMRLMLYPLLSVLAFTIIKTPDLETVEFSLGANLETSGGFGTNQVSTALGLGAFITFMFWWYRWRLTGYRWLDIILCVMFAFRGLLTFSRGGMIGGVLGILILLILSKGNVFANRTFRPVKAVLTTVPILFMLVFTFIYADKITGGQLLLRYQGETPATLRGTKEKNFNTITSNRFQIFKDDLKLWKEYPALGVGVGASSHMRESSNRFLSHVEISRLLSEHGIPGLIYTLILIGLGINIFRHRKFEPYFAILLALFTIAFFTTLHSAMRTYISPLLIGISLLSIKTIPYEEESD